MAVSAPSKSMLRKVVLQSLKSSRTLIIPTGFLSFPKAHRQSSSLLQDRLRSFLILLPWEKPPWTSQMKANLTEATIQVVLRHLPVPGASVPTCCLCLWSQNKGQFWVTFHLRSSSFLIGTGRKMMKGFKLLLRGGPEWGKVSVYWRHGTDFRKEEEEEEAFLNISPKPMGEPYH